MDKRERDRFWKAFIERYSSDAAFWYVPKGGAVKDLNHIKRRLLVLRQFEGQKWALAQRKYVKALKKKGLFTPRAEGQTPADRAAIGRMIKIVFDWLGLAWVDEDAAVLVTSAGTEFLNARKPEDVVEKQLWKLQFWNPSVSPEYKGIQLFAHAFLIRALLQFPEGITPEEYNLFVSRAKSEGDFDGVVRYIKAWRETPAAKQRQILRALKQKPIESAKAREPVSMYVRVDRVRPYAWAFHTSSRRHIEVHGGRLTIAGDAVQAARLRLAEHDRRSTFIEFQTPQEWFAYYGDFSVESTDVTAISVYEKREDIEKAVESFRKAKERKLVPETASVEEYREARIREKVLEDFLEFHLEYLKPGLRLHEEPDHEARQYPTELGNIDLLARNDTDSWVVIELKRDRAGDKVIGQTLR